MKFFTSISFFITLTLFTKVQAQVVTDKNVHLPPPPPTIPAKGNTFVDPTFGTSILRVTDATDGAINTHAYSYWLTMNKNNSYLYIFSVSGQATLYDFDTTNFTIANKRKMFNTEPSGGVYTEDATWSSKNNNIMFCHGDTKLFAYDAAKDTSGLVYDLSTNMPGEYLWQMSRDENDNVFAFTRRSLSDYSFLGYIVYTKSTNSVYKVDLPGLDEVQIDKDGNYLVIKTGNQGAGVVEVEILDLSTKAIENLLDNGPDFAPGHSDNGHGFVVGDDNWNNALTFRELATPHTFTQIIGYGNDWTNALHISMHASNENWCTVSMFGGDGQGSGLYKNEIYQVATDGSGNVRRLAHHHSLYKSYYDSPRGSISMDGRFITFTSNWGDTLRDDVFVLKVPSYIPLGVSANEKFSGISIYPDPVASGEKIYIRNNFDKNASVEIFDVLGQQVLSGLMQTQPLIELSAPKLPAGIYTVRITSDGTSVNRKIIVR